MTSMARTQRNDMSLRSRRAAFGRLGLAAISLVALAVPTLRPTPPAVLSVRLSAVTSGTVGSFVFADASSGTHRVRCGFSASGGLVSVAVPAPKVKPASGWYPKYAGQWVKWV